MKRKCLDSLLKQKVNQFRKISYANFVCLIFQNYYYIFVVKKYNFVEGTFAAGSFAYRRRSKNVVAFKGFKLWAGHSLVLD